MKRIDGRSTLFAVLAGLVFAGCSPGGAEHAATPRVEPEEPLLDKYTTFRLEADLGDLKTEEREMLRLLIDAARVMDGLFWQQAYGDKEALLSSIEDAAQRRFAEINYGPWDRLDGNRPFVPGVGEKPRGANFYPPDMTAEELEAAAAESPQRDAALRGPYSIVRRDDAGRLAPVPYHEAFAAPLARAAAKLREAAALAPEASLARYLELRAAALETDDYRPSDVAWMEMKDNRIDVVIGPIENYEDRLFGYKTAYEAFVLVKDLEWSRRLERYVSFLPDLQRGLPVPEAYKREMPGGKADLNAYDVLYYAGDCNAGSKTIAINLPNDETIQDEHGSRRLQLKNAMRAKFEKVLVPIADVLIDPAQRRHVTFDAFFANTMFHEVAHGLGIKQTIDGQGTVREALREHYSALEEGKADVLGLYMVTRLHERGELGQAALADYYTTFLAGIFRSVRFGASSAHGKANMVRFNHFEEHGAFARGGDGTYRVDMERMQQAIAGLSETILRLQGDGDHAAAGRLLEERGAVGPALQADLDRLAERGIPVDVVFEQGVEVLGL